MAHKKNTTLGRNLGDLLSKAASSASFPLNVRAEMSNAQEAKGQMLDLPLHKLKPGKYQPRHEIHPEELELLAESIRSQGLLQPILVRPLDPHHYEILAGERRFQAAKQLGLESVPVIIKTVEDKEALAIALIENIQRENLNPLEEALALERLTKEFNLTQQQAAEVVGKSRVTVTNLLRILTLADDVKAMLKRGDIDMGHAKVLLAIKSSLQGEIARQIVSKGLSVRETERLVARHTGVMTDQKPSKPPIDPDIRRLENDLSQQLGTVVQILHGSQGKGKLVIHYHNLEGLEGILSHIQKDKY